MTEKIKKVPELRFPGYEKEWRHGRVDTFLVLQRGFDLTKKTSSKGAYPVYSSSGISYFHDEFKVRGPGLVTGRKGSVGPVFYVEEDFWPHDTSLWVKDFKGNNVVYCYYFLTNFNLSRFDEASSVPTLNRNNVHRENAAFPTLPEQQKIAEFLTAVDGRIAQLSRKKALLEDYKKGVMQQLFTQALRFKDDDGNEFPDWEEVSLGDIADTSKRWSFTGGPFGSNLKSEDYTDEGVRIIQLQNIGDGEFLNDYKIYTSEEKADELLSCNIYPGDLLLSKMGDPVARACIVPKYSSRYVMCSDGIRLAVNEARFDKYFVFCQINYRTFRNAAITVGTGSTRKRIGLMELRELPLAAPSLIEQAKIGKFLSVLDHKIESVAAQISHTQTWKKGLLQQMFV